MIEEFTSRGAVTIDCQPYRPFTAGERTREHKRQVELKAQRAFYSLLRTQNLLDRYMEGHRQGFKDGTLWVVR